MGRDLQIVITPVETLWRNHAGAIVADNRKHEVGSVSSRELLQQLDGALEAGGKALDGLMAFLARESSREGRMDTERMDAWQVEVYQVAHAFSALRVAGHARAYGEKGELEALLALAFGGRTLGELRGRLGQLALHLPEGGAAATEFATDAGIAQVVRATTSVRTPKFLRRDSSCNTSLAGVMG